MEAKIPAGLQFLLKQIGIKPEEIKAQIEGFSGAADAIVKKLTSIENTILDVQNRVKHLESCVQADDCNTVTSETLRLPEHEA